MSEATTDTLDAPGVALDATLPSRPGVTAVPGAIERGALIDRYVVLSRLGAGAMGVVMAAYDPQLDRKVALKLLKAGDGAQTGARARLQREAQALAKLDHRNVVRVHDVGVHAGQLFVSMEFVEGRTLGEWMKSLGEPRPWAEIVRVFTEAGRGLAAAHEAGLVHRDFKPDNVMLGDDGRARVMDFGLARAATDEDSDPGTPARRTTATDGSQQLGPLTQTGALMGTPAYMSYEQFEGQPADARSDQFGFCVALCEALYGERPFVGHSLGQLMLAVQGGDVKEAPRGSTVPTWLRRVVLKGLATPRHERHESMQALLDALADNPAVRRRKWGAAAIVVGLLGGGAWGLVHTLQQDAQVCEGMDDKLAGVWDDERRARVKAAIEQTQLSYAGETWERVTPWLDDYTQRWVAARTEACEATHRGEQSGELLDLRMACLDERLRHVRATVDVLAQADEAVVKQAVQAVASLPSLDRCADVTALTADIPPPDDPQTAERVGTLNDQLVEASALKQAGKYEQAIALVDQVVIEAGALDYEPLAARAGLLRGTLHERTGDYEAAAATLGQAYETALALGMTAEASSASTELMYVVGYVLARPAEGRCWAVDSGALARAVGTDAARARHLDNLGNLAKHEGNYAQARGYHEGALALMEKGLGPDHPAIATTLNNLGAVADSEGRYEEAREYFERALAIRERALGPEHPYVANSLNNLGIAAESEGKYAQARSYQERALEIKEKALGPDHPHVANSLSNLGDIARVEGKPEQALEYHERARAIRERAFGVDHPDVAASLNSLGNVYFSVGNYEEARDHQERALAIEERALGPEHPNLAYDLTSLGEALLALGRAAEAVPQLERALTLRTAHPGEPSDLALVRFILARALWDAPADTGRDRVRARELAELARTIYADAGETSATSVESIETWLREHAE